MTASTSSRSWIKPAAIGAVVLALAGIGYTSFSSSTPAPDVTFIGIDGENLVDEVVDGLRLGVPPAILGVTGLELGEPEGRLEVAE